MESYIGGLIRNLAQLRDMPGAFVQMYCRIAAHKFFFFCDPHKRGSHSTDFPCMPSNNLALSASNNVR